MKRLNLFFDADDTILDFDKAETFAITSLFKDYNLLGYENIIEGYKKRNKEAWELFESGLIHRDQIGYYRFKKLFDDYNISGFDISKTNEDYWSYLAKGAFVIDGARELLDDLYKKHNLYVITNGMQTIQESRFQLSNMAGYFIKRYVSETLNSRKPEKEFFDYIENDLGVLDRENTYIIGDSLTSDIKLGINTNVKTIWYNAKNKKIKDDITPDYIVYSYQELKILIEKLSEK